MKAELSLYGELTVYPESAVEAYALKKWLNDYMASADECSLTIDLDEQPWDLPRIADLKGGPS